jgi:hypothetical protein
MPDGAYQMSNWPGARTSEAPVFLFSRVDRDTVGLPHKRESRVFTA